MSVSRDASVSDLRRARSEPFFASAKADVSLSRPDSKPSTGRVESSQTGSGEAESLAIRFCSDSPWLRRT